MILLRDSVELTGRGRRPENFAIDGYFLNARFWGLRLICHRIRIAVFSVSRLMDNNYE